MGLRISRPGEELKQGRGADQLVCWETGADEAQAKSWEFRSFNYESWVSAKVWG